MNSYRSAIYATTVWKLVIRSPVCLLSQLSTYELRRSNFKIAAPHPMVSVFKPDLSQAAIQMQDPFQYRTIL